MPYDSPFPREPGKCGPTPTVPALVVPGSRLWFGPSVRWDNQVPINSLNVDYVTI